MPLVRILGSGLGIASPALLGAAFGATALGLAASAGGIAGGGASFTAAHGSDRLWGPAPPLTGIALGAFAAGHGWATVAMVVALSGAAALIGGYSRRMAVATIRLTVALVLTLGMAETVHDRLHLAALMTGGTLGTLVAAMLVHTIASALTASSPARQSTAAAPAKPEPTSARKRARWLRHLRDGGGWRFPLRLTVALAPAEALAALWPEHHAHWAALTVVLLTQRTAGATSLRAVQRGAGTMLGVALAGLALLAPSAGWVPVATVGLLGMTRPWLAERNPLLYSAAMSLMVMTVMEAGRPVDPGPLVDRITATLAGIAFTAMASALFAAPTENKLVKAAKTN